MAGRRAEGGAAAVEFALVVPILLLLVFGIIQYGYQYWSLSTAAAAAREAARSLVVGTDLTCVRAEALAKAGWPHLGAGDPTVTVEYGTPPSSATPAARGELVTVTVELQSLDLGFLPVPGSGRVVESATNRVENVPVDPLPC